MAKKLRQFCIFKHYFELVRRKRSEFILTLLKKAFHVPAKGSAVHGRFSPGNGGHLFQQFQHLGQCVQITRVGVHVQNLDVTVDEFVSGEAVHTQEIFYGTLLFGRQVVVYHVVARHIVLLDNLLPRLVATVVGQVKIQTITQLIV